MDNSFEKLSMLHLFLHVVMLATDGLSHEGTYFYKHIAPL